MQCGLARRSSEIICHAIWGGEDQFLANSWKWRHWARAVHARAGLCSLAGVEPTQLRYNPSQHLDV